MFYILLKFVCKIFVFSRGYLRDLIEAFHIFLKMLEKYCTGKSHIVVQVSLDLTRCYAHLHRLQLPWCRDEWGDVHVMLHNVVTLLCIFGWLETAWHWKILKLWHHNRVYIASCKIHTFCMLHYQNL